MDPTILQALTSHSPALITGAVLLLVVYAAKLGPVATQWQRLPAWSRPLVPVAIGILAGVGDALVTDKPWTLALITETIAALPALAVALPSPVAHLDQVILPDSPAVRITTTPSAADVARAAGFPPPPPGKSAADQMLGVDRDTQPTDAPKG